MSPHISKCRQQGRNSETLVNWTPDTVSQKRKKQHSDEQKPQPSKRNKIPPQIGWSNKPSPRYSLDRKSPDGIQTTSPRIKVSLADIFASDSPHNVSELSNGPTSRPDCDHLSLMDDFSLSQPTQHQDLHDEFKLLEDSPETRSNEYKIPAPGDDAPFSQYLRSQSPSSSSSTKGFGDNNDRRINSHTVNPSKICLSTEEDPYLAGLIDPNTIESNDVPVKAEKPRITLRIRQPEQRPKSKVLLRLSQPKQPLPKKSVRRIKPDVNDRRRRRTRS